MWLGLVWLKVILYILYFFKRERNSFTTSLMPSHSLRTETQSRVPREQDLATVASEPDTCACKDSEAASGTCIGGIDT